MKMKKQIILLICFVLSTILVSAPEDPFIITTPAELDAMRNNLTASYALGNDIESYRSGYCKA